MGSEEGLRELAEYCEELERRGCFVEKRVKVKDTNRVHKSFRGKVGTVLIDDPMEDRLVVDMGNCTVEFSRCNIEDVV